MRKSFGVMNEMFIFNSFLYSRSYIVVFVLETAIFTCVHRIIQIIEGAFKILIGNKVPKYTPYSQMADTREKTGA